MGPEEYVTRFGWKIFPVHGVIQGRCTCGKTNCQNPGKHPRTSNGFKDATTDLAVIREWWRMWPTANIGVATGRISGIFVVDIDPRNGGFQSMETFETERPDGSLPGTLTALTGGGGRHLFFKYPTDGVVPSRKPWIPGVDIKSDGGYVILPPGTHISGGRYEWLNVAHATTVQAPPDLLQSISDVGGAGQTRDELPDTSTILQGIPEGERDNTLYRAACRWRRQLNDDKAAVTVLVLEAARNCTPPFPEDEARRKVEQAFKQDHTDDNVEWGFITQGGDKLRHLTDLGNAYRLIDHYGEHLKFVPAWGWLEWTDIGWQRIGTERFMKYSVLVPEVIRWEGRTKWASDTTTQRRWTKHSMNSESAGSLSAMERLARGDSRVLSEPEHFDANPHLLACRNGVVDLRTGDIRDFERDDYLTKNTHVQYDPDAHQDEWGNFLKEATLGDVEMVEYLQRAAGYTLTGLTAEECFFVLTGPTASGKSTFLDAMLTCLGLYSITTQSDTFMYKRNRDTARDEMATLAGMRLVGMSEIPEGAVFNVPLINQVTGGDAVKAKELYKNPFEFKPQFKLWIATNHDPAAQDAALMRRIKRIPFNHTIPRERRDPRLKTLLKDPERGGRAVLAWAVKGAVKWYAGGMAEPDSVKLAIEEYRSENDAFGRFLVECCSIDPSAEVEGKFLYQAYDMWAKQNNEFNMRRPQFNQKMKERGFIRTVTDSYVGIRPRKMSFTDNGVEWV